MSPLSQLPHRKRPNPNPMPDPTMSIPPSFSVKKPKLEPLDLDEKSFQGLNGPPISIMKEKSTVHQLGTANRMDAIVAELPPDFLEPLSPQRHIPIDTTLQPCHQSPLVQWNTGLHSCQESPLLQTIRGPQRDTDLVCRQFWKAGDYEGNSFDHVSSAGGMDHVRVHPKFLHSNATSHKWALGAMAELLDNSLDEVVNGATFVTVDMIRNSQDGTPMLVIEDDGGGMSPDHMRHCMSLGYSMKSKSANTIGQYGNGFKTSTMRLGADVIVFSCTPALDGCRSTKSIGMLSYTFLRETGQEDIIVPMVDYEVQGLGLQKVVRSNLEDWNRNMETIKQWSPYGTEADLLGQFTRVKNHGTRIIIYNLWEDDQGQLELDFDTDPSDIQVRGTNRDEKKILMAKQHPNSRHYLTYRYSLRNYAAILYLRLPKGFKVILRGKEVDHHSLVKDLMFTQKVTYKPQCGPELEQTENTKLLASVTIGFVKDAKKHIDVQGFNVYHKNRLIKPFWRIWNSSGSHGRGVIGVLEANFVEPAHDKQGFERTTVLARLEARLLRMQKTYWFKYCHKLGYYNSYLKKKMKQAPQAQSLSSDCEDWTPKKGPRALARRMSKQEAWPFPFSLAITRALRSKRRRVPSRVYLTAATSSKKNAKPETEAVISSKNRLATEKVTSCPATHRVNGPHASVSMMSTSTYMKEKFAETVIEGAEAIQTAERSENERGPKVKHETSILSKLKATEDRGLAIEIGRRRNLEVQLADLEQQAETVQKSMEKVAKERDNVRDILEEEQRQGAAEDEELRKKLKEALIRVRHLEAENYRLRLTHH